MASIPVTTIRADRPPAATPSQRAAAAVLLVGAAALVIQGGISLVAAYLEARFQPVVDVVARGGQAEPVQLAAAMDGLARALDWRASRSRHLGLAILHEAAARAAAGGDEARGSIEQAVTHYRAGLALAPVEPLVWARLARALMVLDDRAAALAALRQSTLQAAHDPRIQWWRARLWLALWPAAGWDPDDAAQLGRQLQILFDEDPGRLAAMASAYGRLYAVRGLLETAGQAPERLDLAFPRPLSRSPAPSAFR